MLYTEFIAGWISGALGLVVGHPVDTVKVRIQTQSRYHGIVDCIVKTYQKEKALGFFKGMSFPVGSVAISNSLLFGSYSNALYYLTDTTCKDWKNPPANHYVFVAGCFSGLVQVYFTAPVDLIKVRLQNQTDTLQSHKTGSNIQAKYRGPVYCAASIFREEGITGLYRGSTALVLRDVPTVGIYFLTYEVLSKWMTSNGEMPSSWTMLFAGGCAGTVGWAAANPMDVIKSRLQMDGMYKVQYRGMYDCIQKSIKQEGLRVLLKGLTVNSLRAFPVNAVTFLSYEKLLQIL
ncbi:PREDICTED: solute carrier family 25 member 45 isoform X1 [Nanorana parkeri]|uniref:solute carrier family 25 member 45 isoform X1 n=1 Tax=Nanorana parkeri TaxID=125878 RepID=UPI000854205D|nr:PREDICTED: solute carrier family 25 member 45 isoform X1 [Nanorana parkeri]